MIQMPFSEMRLIETCMQNKKIAICIDILEFQANQVLDKKWAGKFPGSLWVYYLNELCEKHGIDLCTGDLALNHVKTGYWDPKEVLIIQELKSYHGAILGIFGAQKFLQTALESPLYAYDFYDKLPSNYNEFPYRFLFSGVYGSLIPNHESGNKRLFFPSYDENNFGEITKWKKRKNLVLVAANKYYGQPIKIPLYKNPKHYLVWLRDVFKKMKSPSRREAIQKQLHDSRLDLIKFFMDREELDIYGAGWADQTHLPKKKWDCLKQSILKKNITTCPDKQLIMSSYRFAICFENISYPGYVTEKIIDCFVAGVIPVYLGAPDIADFIPSNLFIDASKFKSPQLLREHLISINETDAMSMIRSAKAFLASEAGKEFSYQGFAKKVLSLALRKDNLSAA
jgi:hypothetical protein